MVPAIQKIQLETRDVLRKFTSTDERVALLDYPNHFNAGDTLIYRGELIYLNELSGGVGYVCATHTYDSRVLAEQVPTGPIFLQGGGNFGDRYYKFQQFRERVITEHGDRTIVQLPQTMEFADGDRLKHTQRIYSEHPDLHLLIRDRAGYERATELFPANDVLYCPDLAFGAGSLDASGAPDRDVVLLKRRDRESVHGPETLPAQLLSQSYRTDWHASVVDNFKWWPVTLAGMGAHKMGALRRPAYPYMRRAFDWQADIIIDNAIDILSRGRIVVTDRLHATVFAALMGKPVVMVDNANKKVSAAYHEYIGAVPDVYLADDFGHAAKIVESLL